MTYQVEKEFIMEAHDAACNEWKKKIERQFPEIFPIVKYGMGDRFKDKHNEYILAKPTQDTWALICLKSGNRWTEAKRIEDQGYITQEQFDAMTGRGSDFFTRTSSSKY